MTTTQEHDWREAYRSLTPEQQEQEQLTPAPVFPKGKSNSFTLLSVFSNDCHDENGRFCEGDSNSNSDSNTSTKFTPDNVREKLGYEPFQRGVPTKHLYRAVSEEDYARIQKEGKINSRGVAEGTDKGLTFADWDPGNAPYRIAAKDGGVIMKINVAGTKWGARGPGRAVLEQDTPASRIEKAIHIPKPSTTASAFSNECHDEKGRFCGDGEGSTGKVEGDKPAKESREPVVNFGFTGWNSSRKAELLDQVATLRDKYPVESFALMSVNAGIDPRTNVALEVQALAAVDQSIPTHIDINPNLSSQKWLEKNDPGTTVSTGNLKDVITHEFGHVIEGVMPPRLQRELGEPFLKAISDGFDAEDGKSDGSLFKDLVSKVSEYATDNPSEGIAEAFLQHEKGIHNEYSDHVGAVIEKWKAGLNK